MSRTNTALVILAACSLVTAVYSRQPVVPSGGVKDTELLAVGEAAPDWKLEDAEGKTHSLSAYRGKVLVLDFWATWCGPCTEVMPRMQKLHEKYKERGVVVFGVNSWERNDPLALMKKKRYTYGLLLKGEEIGDLYRIKGLPVVYVIGVDGRIIYRHEGPDKKDLGPLIEKHLTEHGM